MRPGDHSLSFVLLPATALPSREEFRAAWQDVMRGAAAPVERAWGADSIELELDGVSVIVSLMPSPVPNQEAETAAVHSLSAMRRGGFSPAPHVAHLTVVSSSPSAAVLDRLLRHTRVVAALVKATHATAVYEGSAGATHDPEFYLDVVTNEPEVPLLLWNGFSIARKGETVELLTLGMKQLGLPDLLLVAPAGEGNEALSFALDLLGYVVSRGSAIPEGETVGRSAEEKLPVVYVPSPLDADTQVMKVELPRIPPASDPHAVN